MGHRLCRQMMLPFLYSRLVVIWSFYSDSEDVNRQIWMNASNGTRHRLIQMSFFKRNEMEIINKPGVNPNRGESWATDASAVPRPVTDP
jgi:hypothetical protein